MPVHTKLIEPRPGPEGSGYVFEKLGIELLAAEAGALVAGSDLFEERVRQIVGVLERRALCENNGVTAQQLADEFYGLGSRRRQDARIITKAKAEHQHVPSLGVPP